MVDVDKLLLAFFCGATFAFWSPLFGVELSTWQSLEMQIGLGSTGAVLYWLIPVMLADFKKQSESATKARVKTPPDENIPLALRMKRDRE